MLWNHAAINYKGEVVPCCRFDIDELPEHESNLNYKDIDLSNNRKIFSQFREQSLRGEKIPGCHRCDSQDAIKMHSVRKHYNNIFKEDLPNYQSKEPAPLKYLEIFIGSSCNLKCVNCNPFSSTKWIRDYEALGRDHEARDAKKIKGEIDYSGLISQLPDLERLKILGGEVFFNSKHLSLLQAIQPKARKNITIKYFTNATLFPPNEVMALWNEFKKIEVSMSIDACRELSEILRFPGKWSQVEKVAHQFFELSSEKSNIMVTLSTTVSNLNLFSLKDVFDWHQAKITEYPEADHGHKIMGMSPVFYPSYLSPQNLPAHLIEPAKKYLSQVPYFKQVIDWIELGRDKPFDKTVIKYMESLDRIRGTDSQNILKPFKLS